MYPKDQLSECRCEDNIEIQRLNIFMFLNATRFKGKSIHLNLVISAPGVIYFETFLDFQGGNL
jgi:hypothetical protein